MGLGDTLAAVARFINFKRFSCFQPVIPEMSNYLRIKLTDRKPVKISEKRWPIVAGIEDWDASQLGLAWHEVSRSWWLRVRKHADGRFLVYGSWDSALPNERTRWGGYRLGAGADIVATIYELTEELGLSECTADQVARELGARSNDRLG